MKKQKPTRTPKTYKKRWISTLVEYELYGDEYVKTHEEGYWYAGPMALATTDPNWVVTYWRFGNDGTESGHTWVAAENTNPAKGDIAYDTTYFFRIDVEEDSGNNSKNTTAQLYYNLNGAGATIVNATSSVVRATATSNIADGADTTQRLSGTYTFDTTNEGFDEVDGLAGGGTADLNSTGMEFLFSFQVRSADVSEDDTIVLSIVLGAVNNDDSPTYPTWPTITGAASAATDYSLDCAAGSFSHTGSTISSGPGAGVVAGTFSHTGSVQTGIFGDVTTGTSGTFSHTGSAATFSVGYVFDCTDGSFSHIGSIATPLYTPAGGTDFPINCDAGTFSHTGSILSPSIGVATDYDAGIFSHTGSEVTLTQEDILTAAPGVFSHTGSVATLEYVGIYSLDCNTLTYSHTGSEATLDFSAGATNYSLDLDTLTYSHTGSNATFQYIANSSLDLATITFDLNDYQGSQTQLQWRRQSNRDSLDFTWVGSDATFEYIFNGSLDADTITYSHTGSAATLDYSTAGVTNYNLNCEAGTFSHTGSDNTGTLTRIGQTGQFDFTGSDAVLVKGAATDFSISCNTGLFSHTGSAVTIIAPVITPSGTGSGGGRFFTPSRKIRKRRSRKNVKKKIKQVVRQRLEFRPVKVDDDKLNLITRRIENILDDLYRLDEIYQMARVANEVEKGKSVPGEQIEELKEAVGVFIPVVDEVIQEETKIPYDKKHDNIIAMLLAA